MRMIRMMWKQEWNLYRIIWVRPDWGDLGRMDETNLVRRVRKSSKTYEEAEKIWDELVKEDMKRRGLCINDAQGRKKWRRCCKSGRPRFNWKKDPAIKAKRKRMTPAEDRNVRSKLFATILAVIFAINFLHPPNCMVLRFADSYRFLLKYCTCQESF